VTGHIVINDLKPSTPTGLYPAKAAAGERVPVRATVFKDGHDVIAARLVAQAPAARPDRKRPTVVVPLVNVGNDEWRAYWRPETLGLHDLVIEAWTDRYATWAHKVRVKLQAGQDVDVEIAEGVLLIEDRLTSSAEPDGLLPALGALKDTALPPELRLAPSLSAGVAAALAGPEHNPDRTTGRAATVRVDRDRALVGAWYELFPRSLGGLRATATHVPVLASMGFDVLYLPPIHPIGTTFRKGRNNSLGAGPGDPGSPWAIGSNAGGHTAIDPGLGTFGDFSRLLDTLAAHGMEVALDYALQCSPDHPWVRQHPEWFHHRPDGSIAFAENPPKKYQDIYPLNFWPEEESDRVGLWQACRDVMRFWIDRGVRIFRVDNPHTKPIAFWEWMIPDVQRDHPDVVLLAEAFTRPKVMAKLAEVGFSQSYTYFTWRTEQHGAEGLRAYLEELAGDKADFMRPSFWPNTPDILSGPLRAGPPAAFAERLVLAATMAPSWGMYSGYELFENEPASPDNEEYLYSEKYEIKHRDFGRADSLVTMIATINHIRRSHPALQRLRTIRFHQSDNPQIIVYSKVSDEGDDVMLMVVSLDPYHPVEATLGLDLGTLGLPWDQPFVADDCLSGERYDWYGPNPYVKLEPWARVAHVLHLPEAHPPPPPGAVP
jgi:starch synthase (maltosyl-transferring)